LFSYFEGLSFFMLVIRC